MGKGCPLGLGWLSGLILPSQELLAGNPQLWVSSRGPPGGFCRLEEQALQKLSPWEGQGRGLDPGRLVCKPLATESPVSISVT